VATVLSPPTQVLGPALARYSGTRLGAHGPATRMHWHMPRAGQYHPTVLVRAGRLVASSSKDGASRTCADLNVTYTHATSAGPAGAGDSESRGRTVTSG
jgi:hypothetical protein